MRPSARLILIAALTVVVGTAGAATVAPPASLDDLAVMSDSVVLAEAVESYGIQGTMFPRTVTVFRVVDAVGGARPGTYFDVAEPGGATGDKGFAISGVTNYHPGNTYLLFLVARPDGRWASRMLAYGTFVEDAHGHLVPVPEARDIGLVCADGVRWLAPYPEQALLAHLRSVAGGGPAAPMPEPLPGSAANGPSPSACRQLTYSDGLPVRWFGFETTTVAQIWATTPGQSGLADGGIGAVSGAANAWSGYPNAAMKLLYQGVRPASVNCSVGASSANNVVFDDPCNEITDMVGCSGVLAFGGTWFSLSTQPYDGIQWHVASAPFVVVNNGAECMGATQFAEMMTHELGHSLGFGHHTDPDATMYAYCCHGARGAGLGTTDGQCASWQYHTFLDVPYDFWVWNYIEGLQNAGITSGCGSGNYCPGQPVQRSQMAVFLLKSVHGSSYSPPACSGIFGDVACPGGFAVNWIEQLFNEGITAGCGGGNFCPGSPVTRAQMAVFLLRAKHGSSYTPPTCAGIFSDVPCPGGFAVNWIEQLFNEGITAGCDGANFCPNASVNRDQMAVFLDKTFSLSTP
ncbi:MAG: S-layer homology domain-containing protein [Acidobacteria bacterium]|nr:S-layer homology domain-containing protein [Acidobacteriota bacterium]